MRPGAKQAQQLALFAVGELNDLETRLRVRKGLNNEHYEQRSLRAARVSLVQALDRLDSSIVELQSEDV